MSGTTKTSKNESIDIAKNISAGGKDDSVEVQNTATSHWGQEKGGKISKSTVQVDITWVVPGSCG